MLLTVLFPSPGFFLVDMELRLTLDGQEFYRGSFMQGFARTVEIASGPHTLHLDAPPADPLRRARDYPFELPDGSYRSTAAWTLTLEYSRFWGSFSRKAALASTTP